MDLPEPLPVEKDFFLPTILLLVGPTFEPLAPPTIFHELDQVEAEELLAHHDHMWAVLSSGFRQLLPVSTKCAILLLYGSRNAVLSK